MKEIIKKIEKIAKTDKKEAVKMLSSAFQAIDKSVQKALSRKTTPLARNLAYPSWLNNSLYE